MCVCYGCRAWEGAQVIVAWLSNVAHLRLACDSTLPRSPFQVETTFPKVYKQLTGKDIVLQFPQA